MVVAWGSFMTWFRLYWYARASQEDSTVRYGLIFLQLCLKHIDTNSRFFYEKSICGTRYQKPVFS